MTIQTLSLLPTDGPGEAFASSRDRTPLRRHSRLKGREGVFWRSTTRQEVRRVVLAARRYELVARQPGSRIGPLGHVAIEILDQLANMVDFRTGRLDPSIETLMARLKRSRDAIVRALKALRDHGFLDWLRRYVPTGNEGRGPQVQQTSNAYRLSIPARALRLLGRMMTQAPAPDDFTHAQALRTAELDAYQATLRPSELPLFLVEDEGLREALARLGRGVERESAKRTESEARFIK